MKNFFRKYSGLKILEGAMLIVVGALLICFPNATLLAFCYLLGAGILLMGILNLFEYVTKKLNEPLLLTTAITQAIIGIFVLAFAKEMTSPEVFSILCGVVLLVYGLFRIQPTIVSCQYRTRDWLWNVISTVFLIGFSIVLMARPFETQHALLYFMGIVIILSGIWGIISVFLLNTQSRKIKKEIKKNFVESKISDDTTIVDVQVDNVADENEEEKGEE